MGAETTVLTNRRNNCLNLIRLIAALDVVYGHTIEHLAINSIGITLGNTTFDIKSVLDIIFKYIWGVPVFFFLSGFLIWDSIDRSRDLMHFLTKRVLRLFPELWVAVFVELVSIIVLYKNNIKWFWLVLFGFTQGTFLQFWTPNFLRGYGCGTPNGALWTICVIIQFYLIAWWLKKLLSNKPAFIWVSVLFSMIIIGLLSPLLKKAVPLIAYKLYAQTLTPYIWMFFVGSLVSQFFDKCINKIKQIWPFFLVFSIIIVFVIKNDVYIGLYPLLTCISLYITIIGFAYSFPKINVKRDISYGIYLYHMIIINAFIALGMKGLVDIVYIDIFNNIGVCLHFHSDYWAA